MNTKVISAILVTVLVMAVATGAVFVSEIGAQVNTYKIGDRGPGGGLIFYDKGSRSGGWRYLEAAPVDQSSGAEWGCSGKVISGAAGTAIGTGKSNTAAIIKSCGESGIAARVAAAYRGGGKGDWFLPSKDELTLMYEILFKNGEGGFDDDAYWSSSGANAGIALGLYFKRGYHNKYEKNLTIRVRAVRAF